MNYLSPLKLHFKPKKGWMNDPNGLVYFNGYYHAFYQHAPNHEIPWQEPMHWGHARTKDFIEWEELPVAFAPDMPYDSEGCFSGTAIVRDDILYLFYASIRKASADEAEYARANGMIEAVSVAYSKDGINFEKYAGNPVIPHFPEDGSSDFRDPAVCFAHGKYYMVMASGYPKEQSARLLIYESKDMFSWEYKDIMSRWENAKFAECPSFMEAESGKYLLTASVCHFDYKYFSAMYGSFENGIFTPEITESVDKGPDQYAGQVFRDPRGRNILIAWLPGWRYKGYAEKDVGCLSVPREMKLVDGKVLAYPVEELQPYLKDSDPALKMTDDGFIIERTGRDPVIHKGRIDDIKILRDEYIIEVFVNRGEIVYSVLL